MRYLTIAGWIVLGVLSGCTQSNSNLTIAKASTDSVQIKVRPMDSSARAKLAPKKRKFLEDLANHRNTVFIADMKYISDGDFRRYVLITVKNTTTEPISAFRFRLEGILDKGCIRSYDIKRKIRLKPNHTYQIRQELSNGDCEFHKVNYVEYVTKDGTLKIGV